MVGATLICRVNCVECFGLSIQPMPHSTRWLRSGCSHGGNCLLSTCSGASMWFGPRAPQWIMQPHSCALAFVVDMIRLSGAAVCTFPYSVQTCSIVYPYVHTCMLLFHVSVYVRTLPVLVSLYTWVHAPIWCPCIHAHIYCPYSCPCIPTYMPLFVSLYTCIHAPIHVTVYLHTCPYSCSYIHTYMPRFMSLYTHIHALMSLYTCFYFLSLCTYIHAPIYVPVYVHTFSYAMSLCTPMYIYPCPSTCPCIHIHRHSYGDLLNWLQTSKSNTPVCNHVVVMPPPSCIQLQRLLANSSSFDLPVLFDVLRYRVGISCAYREWRSPWVWPVKSSIQHSARCVLFFVSGELCSSIGVML